MFGYYLLMVLAVGAFTKMRAVFAYGRVTFEFTVALFISGCISQYLIIGADYAIVVFIVYIFIGMEEPFLFMGRLYGVEGLRPSSMIFLHIQGSCSRHLPLWFWPRETFSLLGRRRCQILCCREHCQGNFAAQYEVSLVTGYMNCISKLYFVLSLME